MMPVKLSSSQGGCAAVAIRTNVYSMGGVNVDSYLSSVDILGSTVTGTIQKGPSMMTE